MDKFSFLKIRKDKAEMIKVFPPFLYNVREDTAIKNVISLVKKTV